ncbi:bifunctional diguanylate cyclase/phosphodiesterase [Solwaraspora sp. WMMD406]|uniref:putative bifunctional diguanylate cyclase/phosphodiesterase n=1 Tax=Solwaraspora sp. WMMD406 TaxID=3016095 RepID=UPI00241738E9|nr:bifunctional diguanylate cyclase/phosphodiesterase [Solwaraspora sp. WMMD406]MDG4767292.1 bifunctional diguanylate cyclase/phosphodiesterase [Solwaraspora sp. WMMD406]
MQALASVSGLSAVLATGLLFAAVRHRAAAADRVRGTGVWSGQALRDLLDCLAVGAALWFTGWVLVSPPTLLLGAGTPTSHPAMPLGTATIAFTAGVALVTALRRRGACRGTGYAFAPMALMAVAGMYHVLRGGQFTAAAVAVASVEGMVLVAGQYVALLEVRRYADQLAGSEAHFRRLAHTDPLTGLANRRALLHELYDRLAGEGPGVLFTFDLDGFKHVNDMRGHDVGDAVLIEVGRRLSAELGDAGLTARLGGDEFAALLPLDDPAESHRTASRLLRALNAPYPHESGPVYLSVSIGIACRSTAADVPSLLRNADLALRSAKQRGKNRAERYDLTYDQAQRRRTLLEHEMRGAIDRDELRLAFQPVVAVPSVRPVGAEALIRWQHPELGRVPPDEFIPLAEECGMINQLGAWVLDEACRQLSSWLADGHDVWASVNVSPHELHDPEYVVQVDEALRRHRVPPQRLVLEVTEHAVARDLAELIRRLKALRSTGVRIALDDFGAGYSSLGQLRNLPIDILKIDHSLVADQGVAGQEPARASAPGRRPFAPMVDVVMRLGHQLGLEVIAEGVTNPDELAVVVEAGCRFGQGALFGWGVPAEHLEAMLVAANSAGLRRARTPDRLASRGTPTPVVQDVRSVDSSHEMRQA